MLYKNHVDLKQRLRQEFNLRSRKGSRFDGVILKKKNIFLNFQNSNDFEFLKTLSIEW